jgi:hypothetical protein
VDLPLFGPRAESKDQKSGRPRLKNETLRDTDCIAYRCFLPDLTEFTTVRHAVSGFETQAGLSRIPDSCAQTGFGMSEHNSPDFFLKAHRHFL